MNFACIQNCKICPLNCDVSKKVYKNIEKSTKNAILPKILQKNEEIKEEFAENTQILTEYEHKNELLEISSKTEEIEEEKESEIKNLPILSDVQYIENPEAPKKGFFDFLRRKKR